ncbi:hypothetical protein UlMin_026316 [Ulmus minor]
MNKILKARLVLVILLFIEGAQLCERWALLKLKRSFKDPANRLAYWSGKDCCHWEGVRCNEKTGHVVHLNLSPSLVYKGGDYWFNNFELLSSPELNSCLLELKHLEHLDLSGNDFNGSQIPSFLGYMKHLRYLNLSFAGFSGIIPPQLGNLSSLQILDLGYQRETVDNLNWVSSLSSLQYLGLSTIPSLLQIQLVNCSINSIHLPQGYKNSTFLSKVQLLDLRGNMLSGPIPNILHNMTSLRELYLSSNDLNSTIPLWLNHHKSLVHLDLSSNHFDNIEGGVLSMLNNACSLKSLDLSFNALRGEVLGSNHTSSGCIVYYLESLRLMNNEIGGNIPSWFGRLKSLKYLYLYSNSLYGPIPSSLGQLPILGELDLSNNLLNGTIPQSLGKLSSLEVLDLSSNSLVGIFSELHFANLSRLKQFNIGSNHLSCKVKSDWIPPFRLRVINMSSCNIGSQFPRWLQTQTEVSLLDLSNSNISGSFPTWLQGMSLYYLDLSMNSIGGQIPTNIFHRMHVLEILRLSSNLLNGSIPNSLCKVEGLQALDLSKNQLYGEIPDCWPKTIWLVVINLSFNKLSGHIPSSFGRINDLRWLHLNENGLSGELPLTLQNSTGLRLLDVGENKITGNIPTWIGEKLLALQILRLRNNMFSGSIPSQLCKLSVLQIMDLAENNLTGGIPSCFRNLTSMTAEKDVFRKYSVPSDDIPNNIGKMKFLESLDLSNNHLFGTIPKSLAELSYLSYLNLSNNNLSGRIPTGNQLQVIEDPPSSYAGNVLLCGTPLEKQCPGDDEPDQPPMSIIHGEDEDKSERFWFYFVVVLGYGTGFWAVIGILILKKNWRVAYFRFADNTKEWILMMIAVEVERLKKKIRRTNSSE